MKHEVDEVKEVKDEEALWPRLRGALTIGR
jgi:hypothetical protein